MVNLTKYVQDPYIKTETQQRKILKTLCKSRDMPYSLIERLSTVKIPILPKLTYILDEVTKIQVVVYVFLRDGKQQAYCNT